MSDPELVQDILTNIMTAIERIERRFQGIESADDFLADDEGIDRLDGIAMMLSLSEQVGQPQTSNIAYSAQQSILAERLLRTDEYVGFSPDLRCC